VQYRYPIFFGVENLNSISHFNVESEWSIGPMIDLDIESERPFSSMADLDVECEYFIIAQNNQTNYFPFVSDGRRTRSETYTA
jgi:hypothetical protein